MKIQNWIAFLALCCTSTTATTSHAALFNIETKITAADAAASDLFGHSVAISGNTAIVGAWGDDDAGSRSGSAYLFDVTTGNQLVKLTASDATADDHFGVSVAISGKTALIGANGARSAYLFDVTTGNQLTKLTAAGDVFGHSVAISGNTALVGAWWGGGVYLFDVTTGNQLAKLTASDTTGGFGYSLAISGNTALVGAFGDDDAGRQSGAAYLFDVITGNQLAKLTATDAAAGDLFGRSVAISGNTALVGAYRDDDGGTDSGSAYLFDVTTGNQLAKLTAADAAADDVFGYSVAISGNTAIVGAVADDDGRSASGSAYLFDVTTGNQLAKLTASDAAGVDFFGHSVAISGNTALVGAIHDDDGGTSSGSAYLFENIVPEPSTLLLSAFSCLGVLLRKKR